MTKGVSVLLFGRAGCQGSSDLRKHLLSLGFCLTYLESAARGEVLPNEAYKWSGDYIICFRSLFILPKKLIERAAIASINFHPGPPEYPGSGCLNFALYDRVKSYGVTAHLMDEKIDHGPILAVNRFCIDEEDGVDTLLVKTHCRLLQMAIWFTEKLSAVNGFVAVCRKECRNEYWQGPARKLSELDYLMNISLDVSEGEIERLIRATYTSKHRPFVVMHGYKFYLSLDDSCA